MAVSGKTARRLLKFLLTTDPPAIHEQMELLANQLDNDVEGGQGTLAARPVTALRGRLWMVQGDTEANNGVLWWDTGSTWLRVDGTAVTPTLIASTSYTASAARSSGTPVVPSTSRPVHVVVREATDITQTEVKVGTALMPLVGGSAQFILAPGEAFEMNGTAGKPYKSQHRLL